MYSILIIIVLCSSPFGSNSQTQDDRFYKIVVFGDADSDTGNVYEYTNHTWPAVPPYYQGRFCDGPIWIDGVKVLVKSDYAYGGATSDSTFVQGLTEFNTVPVPGIRQQIATYLNNVSRVAFNLNIALSLHVIWGGANDFVFNHSVQPTQIVNSLMNSCKDLLDAGTKNLLVVNVPPVQAIPLIRAYNQTAFFTNYAQTGNNALKTSLAALQQNYTKASIAMFDYHTLISNVLSNNASTFTDTVDQCWTEYNVTTIIQTCSDPTKYVFLDHVHCSSTVHKMVADAVQPFLLGSLTKLILALILFLSINYIYSTYLH